MKKLSKASGIIQLAEVRLSRGSKSLQHDIETHIFDFETEEKQRVKLRDGHASNIPGYKVKLPKQLG